MAMQCVKKAAGRKREDKYKRETWNELNLRYTVRADLVMPSEELTGATNRELLNNYSG